MLLAVNGLAKKFGGVRVFESVSFGLAPGERLGIVGPNGAGKSTLFNLISGTLAPSGGTITYDGADLGKLSPWSRCRAGIGRTFQVPKPFAGMSVRDNLMVAATHGAGLAPRTAAARSDEVLAQCALVHRANHRAADLGLLDLKRLELARALALRPKLLLLDEIAGGLSGPECDELLDILRVLDRFAIAVLWIEHQISVLSRFAPRLLVLAAGAVIATGTPDAVFADANVRRLYLGDGG